MSTLFISPFKRASPSRALDFSLALSKYTLMNTRQYAKALGRRGGRARARNLSAEQRKKIASMGGKSRALSRHAARRIEENFKYLEAIEDLRKAAVIHEK